MPKTDANGQRSFFVWHAVPSGNNCSLSRMDGFDTWRLLEVGTLAKFWNKVEVHMDPEYPRDVALVDVHEYTPMFIIAPRVKALLEEQKVKDVEYLPISIIDHKGRVASADYFGLNVTRAYDCLDIAQSQPRYSAIEKGSIDRVKQTIIDGTRVPVDARLFRIQNYPRPLVIDQSMKDVLEAANLKGVRFAPSENFPRRL